MPEVIEVNSQDLKFNPNRQIRYASKSIEDLAEDILIFGQREPILINQNNEVIFGHRRKLAFDYINELRKGAGIEELKIQAQIVVTKSEDESLLMSLHEMASQESLNAIDIANAIHTLKHTFGYTDVRIAELFHKEQPWVSRKAKLFRLPERIKKLVQVGALKEDAAIVFLDLPSDEQLYWSKVAEIQKVTAPQIRARVREIQAKRGRVYKKMARTMPEMRRFLQTFNHPIFSILLQWQSGEISSEECWKSVQERERVAV